jgi:glyoxylase-like metal-dependent hydrolase (beta-lactamase superfamily II)
VPFLEAQTTPQWRAIWEGFFPGRLTERPVVPAALATNELSVEGLVIEVLPLGQSDVSDSSVLHIPELGAVIAGDVVYNGIHPWLYQSDHAARMAWLDTLNRVEELAPTTIIAGHKDPDAPDDEAARTLETTRRYIRDFDAQVAAGASGAALVEAMSARYPDLGNPYTLWLAASSVGHDAEGSCPAEHGLAALQADHLGLGLVPGLEARLVRGHRRVGDAGRPGNEEHVLDLPSLTGLTVLDAAPNQTRKNAPDHRVSSIVGRPRYDERTGKRKPDGPESDRP